MCIGIRGVEGKDPDQHHQVELVPLLQIGFVLLASLKEMVSATTATGIPGNAGTLGESLNLGKEIALNLLCNA